MAVMITDLLKASGADGWTLREEETNGWEFYFIRHNLDQNRVRQTKHLTVTVYKKTEGGKYLGSAAAKISPTADEDQVRALIGALVDEAKLIKNPYYDLLPPRDGKEAGLQEPSAGLPSGQTTSSIAGDFINVMHSLPETQEADINSYEIFVDDVHTRFRTSTGIDVQYAGYRSMLEVICNARNDQHEIELYRMYKSGTCADRALREDIEETLRCGRDKLAAGKTPALGKADVILTTDAALQVYGYFIDRMSAGMVYQGISDWKIGSPVVRNGSDAGDPVTVTARRYLENSSANAPFDPDGAPVRDMVLIRDGIAEHYYGSRQFCEYLKLKDSFLPGNFEVSGGTAPAADIRTGDYLEIVEFSDFQVNPVDGNIFGEIRLGYLHQNGRVTIVEGGSVSGSMNEFARTMRMSAEQKQYDNMLIPAVTRLKDVSITGAE